MADSALTVLGDAEARLGASLALYRRGLGLFLIVYLVAGIAALVAPALCASLLGRAATGDLMWIRMVGALTLVQILFYLPGLQDPNRSRYGNVACIAARIILGLVWLIATGAWIVGLFELAWGAVLAALYLRFVKSEVMSRP